MSGPIAYRRPNESCLEIFRTDIAEKRRLQWSYRAIARSLMDEHQFKIDWTSVRRFCLVRKIEKGVGETTSASPVLQEAGSAVDPPSQLLVRRRKPRENPFHYEDSGPLRTRRNTPALTEDDTSSS
jgi:hypothetical protein